MKSISILDCTLRDGGYLLNKKFPRETYLSIIEGLVDAKIEYIEIGFLQDIGSTGQNNVFQKCGHANELLNADLKGTKLCLLADYSRYSVSNLDYADTNKISQIRATFFPIQLDNLEAYCKEILDKGYELSVQLLDFGALSSDQLKNLINIFNSLEVTTATVVDTYGSIFPCQIRDSVKLLDTELKSSIAMGIHSHNNMQMSLPLVLDYIDNVENRNIILDSSLNGFARAAGNSPTEVLAYYLNKTHHKSYDVDKLINTAKEHIEQYSSLCGYSIKSFVAGLTESHINAVNMLEAEGIDIAQQLAILKKSDAEIRKHNYNQLHKELKNS